MRLIDAGALSERVCFVINNSKELVTSSVVRKAVLSLIDTQPTIKAEPVKHGRWIETENDKVISRISGYCSSCGWEAHLYEDDVIGMPYCPNCGAKMDGGEA